MSANVDHVSPFDSLSLGELRRRRSSKWRDRPPNGLPAWVAESDFPLAPHVKQALVDAVELGDTGYSAVAAGELADAFAGFARRHWNWHVEPDCITPIPDVIAGVERVLRKVTRPGDRVALFLPAYQPFFETLRECGLRVHPLRFTAGDGSWEIDYAMLTAAFASGVRVLLLTNPHNPTGKVFTVAELRRIAQIASRHNVFVISDEVHGPLVLTGRHTPWLSLDEPSAANSVAVTGAAKAFNLAGLKCSVMITSGSARGIVDQLPGEFRAMTGHLGVLASTAAYSSEDAWLAGQIEHLRRNRDAIAEWLVTQPQVRWIPPQATYLALLDLRDTRLANSPAEALQRQCGLAVIDGTEFDPEMGHGWIRVNFGTTTSILSMILQGLDEGICSGPRQAV